MRISRFVYLGVAIFFQALVSGIIFGFPSLQPVLVDAGVFSSECDAGVSGCDAQNVRLGLVFTIAAAMLTASGVILGPLLDRFGPRVVRLCSSIVFLGGCILCGIAPNNSLLWFPAFSMIAFGGGGIQLTSFNVSSLFPSHESTIVGLIAGSFSASSSMFFFAKLAHNNLGMQIRPAFLCYCAVAALCFFTSFLWLDRPFSPDEDLPSSKSTNDKAEKEPLIINEFESPIYTRQSRYIDFSTLPLKKQLLQFECWLMLSWFAVALLTTTFFLSSAFDQLKAIDPVQGPDVANTFGIIYPLGFVGTPLVGILLDRYPFPAVYCFVNVLILAYQSVLLIPNAHVQILSFIVFAICRQYVFALFFAAIGSMFGFRTFGFITGVGNLMSALTTLLNYPLLAYCVTNKTYFVPNVIIAVVTALQIPFSIIMWRRLVSYREGIYQK